MTLIDVSYQPGTQKSPQQTKISAPAFTDTDHVHFPDGRLTTIPPYSTTMLTSASVTMLGAVRAVHAVKLTGTHVGTYTLFGSSHGLYAASQGTLYNITPLKTSGASLTDKIATTNTSKTIVINQTAHGRVVGDRVKITGASDVGGITANTYINVENIVTAVGDANHFSLLTGFAATSTVAAGGGTFTVYGQIADGNINQAAATGDGTGIYGQAIYGQGGPAVTAQTFPRIWSFGNFGNEVVMCPGDYSAGDGQKIYIWDGDLTVAPTILTNAPTDCNWVTVVNNAIVALCGRTVKICQIGDGTVWSGLTYYEKTLERVWKLVSAYRVTEKNAAIFTQTEAILLNYVGGADLWDLSDLYTNDGIIGPSAACLVETTLRWRGARGFYSFDGGSAVSKEVNIQNEEWVKANTNYGQAWKSFSMTDQNEGRQAWHYFPTGTDNEPGDYDIHHIAHSGEADHWTLGRMPRTAAQRPGFLDSTFFMVNGTSVSVAATVYRHFTLGDVTFNWNAKSSFSYADGGNRRIQITNVIPDANQTGNSTMQFFSKEFPQGDETASPEYTVTPTTTSFSAKTAGKLIAWELSGSSAYTDGARKIEVKVLGRN